MKNFVFSSAIICALASTTLVAPSFADEFVTSSNVTTDWSIEAPPRPEKPGPRPPTVPTVKVVVNYLCTNPNNTTQSFDKDFFLFTGLQASGNYVSSQTLHADIAANANNVQYNLVYQNRTPDYPGPGSEWTLLYNLPGDEKFDFPGQPSAPRSDSHTY